MSENPARKPDPRAKRTRNRLGDALIALLVAKPFNEITVQEVLDRAGVSRSTFYEHYRDKNDLFLSDVDEFFEMMSTMLARRNDQSERVAPVAEFCAHVGESREVYAAMLASDRMHDVTELGTAHFARGIAARLAVRRCGGGLSTETRAAQAQALRGRADGAGDVVGAAGDDRAATRGGPAFSLPAARDAQPLGDGRAIP